MVFRRYFDFRVLLKGAQLLTAMRKVDDVILNEPSVDLSAAAYCWYCYCYCYGYCYR
jgi:hypothetical protein